MEKRLNELDERNAKQQKELNDFKEEFNKFKEEYDQLVEMVLENKKQIAILNGKLDDLVKNYKEGDENLQRKIDSLKKYIDDKMLELTTKLDLVLGNVGGTVIENNVDLSGLDDFMQRVISLENKFDDFVHKVDIDDIHRQLKYLTDHKADKKELEQIKSILNDLNKKSQEHQEEIDVLRNRLDSLYQQLVYLSKEVKDDGNSLNYNLNKEGGKKQHKSAKFTMSFDDLDLSKYTLKEDFDKHVKENNEEISKIWDEINRINGLINQINESLNNKADIDDLNELRDFILGKIDDLINDFNKKFADKNETNKSIKNLEDQIKKIYALIKSKHEIHEADAWLLAKKPITGFSCAACESYIGDLRNSKYKFIPWNKLPVRDPGEKLYRMGNGFSRMLNMLNFDNNGNVNLNQYIESNSSDTEKENENESKERKDNGNLNTNEKRNKNKTLYKNRLFQSASTNSIYDNAKLGHKTQNSFYKKEENKDKFLPKLKKEIPSENINEEKPKITKIFKKTNSKF